MCYHIVRWYDSVRAGPAIKRCYRTRQQAHLDKDRGLIGDRTHFHLEPHDPAQGIIYTVIQCPAGDACQCAKWSTGHRRDTIAPKPRRLMIVCHRCHKPGRAAVEVYDPETEERQRLCQRCAERYALGVLFKATRSNRYGFPQVHHVHAEDLEMAEHAVMA